MIIFLRALIALMYASMLFTAIIALDFFSLPIGHILISIFSMILVIFTQAFVIFYFIGAARLAKNVFLALNSDKHLNGLFENLPHDIGPYIKESKRLAAEADRFKRQTVPWGILILLLGMLAFLLGAATDTRMVDKTIHTGVVLGFFVAMAIGVFKQWHYLKKSKQTIVQIRALFDT